MTSNIRHQLHFQVGDDRGDVYPRGEHSLDNPIREDDFTDGNLILALVGTFDDLRYELVTGVHRAGSRPLSVDTLVRMNSVEIRERTYSLTFENGALKRFKLGYESDVRRFHVGTHKYQEATAKLALNGL